MDSERYGRLLDDTRKEIAVTKKEYNKLVNIAVKETLTDDEKTFSNKCLFCSDTLIGHKQKLENRLQKLELEKETYLDLLKKESEVSFIFGHSSPGIDCFSNG